ncbi:MAG: Hydroperoxy fatty acid reductase 1, partial [Pseudomonadota bacterium]
MTSIYDFDAVQMNGQALALASMRGQVMLIVNTASACGFTPQFGGLEKIHQTYKAQGLAVLG